METGPLSVAVARSRQLVAALERAADESVRESNDWPDAAADALADALALARTVARTVTYALDTVRSATATVVEQPQPMSLPEAETEAEKTVERGGESHAVRSSDESQ